MSRNRKIRKISEKLPNVPLVRNGKVQHDGAGNVLYRNHFKKLKTFDKKDVEGTSSYVAHAFSYDLKKKRKFTWKKSNWVVKLLIGLTLLLMIMICLKNLGIK